MVKWKKVQLFPLTQIRSSLEIWLINLYVESTSILPRSKVNIILGGDYESGWTRCRLAVDPRTSDNWCNIFKFEKEIKQRWLMTNTTFLQECNVPPLTCIGASLAPVIHLQALLELFDTEVWWSGVSNDFQESNTWKHFCECPTLTHCYF